VGRADMTAICEKKRPEEINNKAAKVEGDSSEMFLDDVVKDDELELDSGNDAEFNWHDSKEKVCCWKC